MPLAARLIRHADADIGKFSKLLWGCHLNKSYLLTGKANA